uniref:Uncharacterized protein n=1 Tax=Meloidogyne enterolobii TaxID=390850 RepID=A0A6V7VFL6_MELEN|nr:unnamed protein product [Meloidogyne enterolobii]
MSSFLLSFSSLEKNKKKKINHRSMAEFQRKFESFEPSSAMYDP